MNQFDFSRLCKGKAVICGLGRSNEAVVSYLNKLGTKLVITDTRKSKKEIENILQKLSIRDAQIIKESLPVDADFVFRTPGVRPDDYEIMKMVSGGAILTSEAELFFKLAKGKIFGITGSDGKTTTSTIAYQLLKSKYNGQNVYLGGNIGTPLLSFIEELNDESITVCELSSFQLMTMNDSPDRAVITNITQNHLDYHTDMKEYVLAKSNIFRNKRCKRVVTQSSVVDYMSAYGQRINTDCLLHKLDKYNDGIGFDDGYITLFGDKMLNVDQIKVGCTHNMLNFMSAIGLCYDLIDRCDLSYVARSFKGVSHRFEYVCTKNGINYYNSSIDSTPTRTLTTLKSIDNSNITVILGGYDKNLDYKDLAEYSNKKINKFVLCGANSDKIKSTLISVGILNERIIDALDIKQAVELASAVTVDGGIVLLSPASASFDMFVDYEHRGNTFKNIVNAL